MNISKLAFSKFNEQTMQLDCPVCFDTYPISQILTLSCDHKFCESCLKAEWETKIKNHQISQENLICPEEGCGKPITYYELRQHLSKETFQQYEKLNFEQFQLDDCDEVAISCPAPGCTARFIVWKEADYATCCICNFEFCTKCKNKSHHIQKLTCQQAQMSEEDRKFEELMKKENWKKCPKCTSIVELTKWCKFMTCRSSTCQSKTFFCYLCGDQLTKDEHYSHYIGQDAYGDKCVKFDGKKLISEQDNDNEQEKESQIVKIECQACKSQCELIDNLENKAFLCENDKCKGKIYCFRCRKPFNAENEQEQLFDHILKYDCNQYKKSIIKGIKEMFQF